MDDISSTSTATSAYAARAPTITRKKNARSLPLSQSSAQSSSSPSLQSKDFRGGQDAWQSMLYELLAYKVSHNNDVNVKYNRENENTKEHALYLWLQNQRKHYKYHLDGKPSFLNEERIKILEFCGVEWNVRGDAFWENMFEKLKEYRADHGDCLVPRRWEKNQKLGEWVTDQRRQHKYKITGRPSLLTDTRERKLNEIGFAWSLRKRPDWNVRFEELVMFKEAHGHCVVPQMFSQNKALGKWVSKQREQYRRLLDGKPSYMTRERIEQLNDIGFSWNAKGRRNTESLVGTEMMKFVSSTVLSTPASESASTSANTEDTTITHKESEENLVLPLSQNQDNAETYFM